MTVTVRVARPPEYDAVGALTAAAYAVDGFGGGSYDVVLRDAAARAEIGDLLVAVDDDEVLGTVTLVGPEAPAQWREAERPHAGTIRMLAVAADARGRGAGTSLARACVARACAAGWSELTLLTQPDMLAAHRIYGRLGFRREPALDKPISERLTLLGYVLELSSPDPAH
jgi:ribosomal protein S18 acetylase RimI-like enzyme